MSDPSIFFKDTSASNLALSAGYLAFSVFVLITARNRRARRDRDSEAREIGARGPSDPGAGYRASGARVGTLATGCMPEPADLWAVAFVRHPGLGIAHTMITLAMSTGWLRATEDDKSLVWNRAEAPEDGAAPSLLPFIQLLRAHERPLFTHDEILAAARSAAEVVKPGVLEQLSSAGLGENPTLNPAVVKTGGALLLLGLLHLIRVPSADIAGWLSGMIAMSWVGVASFAIGVNGIFSPRKRYEKWLAHAATSLRAAARRGDALTPLDLSLVVAVYGDSILSGVPRWHRIYQVVQRPAMDDDAWDM